MRRMWWSAFACHAFLALLPTGFWWYNVLNLALAAVDLYWLRERP
jgi:hypothetical protein